MNVSTLLKYLLGDRSAILNIARCRRAIWIGLLFVLAAGFAREYDGEDLLHEPWHLLIPLAASVASSLALYLLVRLVAWFRSTSEPGLVEGYRTFLTLYWLTAPLALIYAIPVERFMSAGDAMRVNLTFLFLVALWRVLLITRVVAVVYRTSFGAALFPVMLFADTVVLLIVHFTPLPLFMVMGGVRLSEPDSVLLMTTLFVTFVGYVSLFVWFFGVLFVVLAGARWTYEVPHDVPAPGVARSVWTLAFGSLLIWFCILPFTQPEQRLARRVEERLRAEHIEEGLRLMSEHEPGDFPPHWSPPPHLGRPYPEPDVLSVQETAQQLDLKPWVRQVFDEKYVNFLHGESWMALREMPALEVERRVRLLECAPSAAAIVREDWQLREALEELKKRDDLAVDVRASIDALLMKVKEDQAVESRSRRSDGT